MLYGEYMRIYAKRIRPGPTGRHATRQVGLIIRPQERNALQYLLKLDHLKADYCTYFGDIMAMTESRHKAKMTVISHDNREFVIYIHP